MQPRSLEHAKKILRLVFFESSRLRGCICAIAGAFLVCAGTGSSAQTLQQPQFTDRLDVARIVVDVRALDSMGRAIQGLAAEDFTVKFGDQPARVESATWVGAASGEPTAAEPAALGFPEVAVRRGRLIVFLFQKDLEPRRIAGLMRMLFRAKTFLDTLDADDRVAVVSFDSHLKIWLDFTNDRAEVRRVLERGLLLERPRPIGEPESEISLSRTLSQDAGRRAYPIEKGLRLIGEALEPLPGSKSIVLFGHGFGRYTADGVIMEKGYGEALAALQRARAAVFSIDVTLADYHSLEVGLQSVSEETGGFYERSVHFPDRAVQRLVGALAGHYVLLVEAPERASEWTDVSVKVTRRGATVLARAAAR
jgi:VWFA-related protein